VQKIEDHMNIKKKMTQLELCKKIAYEAHKGQFRNDGVTPYIEHPRRVVELLEGSNKILRCAAWLHDVIEDTEITELELKKKGVQPSIIRLVKILTNPKEDYWAYLRGVKESAPAIQIKIADMLDNLSDNPNEKQKAKCKLGIMFLLYGSES